MLETSAELARRSLGELQRGADGGVMAESNSVFISYRRETGALWALALYQELARPPAVDAFYDIESMNEAGRFDTRILDQIAARPYFLLALTPGTLQRCQDPNDWLRREIEHAVATERIIIPLFTAEFQMSDCAAFLSPTSAAKLASSQGVKLDPEYFSAGAQRLRRMLVPVSSDEVALSPVDDEHAQAVRAVIEQAPAVTPVALQAQRLVEYARERPSDDTTGKLADLNAAIDLDPSYSRAYYQRALVRRERGDSRGATDDMRRATQLDPSDPDPRHLLAPLQTRRRFPRWAVIGAGAAAVVAALVVVLVVVLAGSGGRNSTTTTTQPPARDALNPGEVLHPGEMLTSSDGQQTLEMRTDGSLVASTGPNEWWRAPKKGRPGANATMQTDGNFVVYQPSPVTAVWATNTNGHGGAHLALETILGKGYLTVYGDHGRILWREPAPQTSTSTPPATTAFVRVPDVEHLQQDVAVQELHDQHLSAQIETTIQNDVAAGTVVRTDPPGGTSVHSGSTVTVFVATNEATVPNVLGLTADAARAAVGAARLQPIGDAQSSSDVVVQQDPPPGSTAAQGSSVTLTFGSGATTTSAPIG
jgi:hypothetical protein